MSAILFHTFIVAIYAGTAAGMWWGYGLMRHGTGKAEPWVGAFLFIVYWAIALYLTLTLISEAQIG